MIASPSHVVTLDADGQHLPSESSPIDPGFVEGTVTSHYRPLLDTLRIARTVVVARAWPVVRTAGSHARTS